MARADVFEREHADQGAATEPTPAAVCDDADANEVGGRAAEAMPTEGVRPRQSLQPIHDQGARLEALHVSSERQLDGLPSRGSCDAVCDCAGSHPWNAAVAPVSLPTS